MRACLLYGVWTYSLQVHKDFLLISNNVEVYIYTVSP